MASSPANRKVRHEVSMSLAPVVIVCVGGCSVLRRGGGGGFN